MNIGLAPRRRWLLLALAGLVSAAGALAGFVPSLASPPGLPGGESPASLAEGASLSGPESLQDVARLGGLPSGLGAGLDPGMKEGAGLEFLSSLVPDLPGGPANLSLLPEGVPRLPLPVPALHAPLASALGEYSRRTGTSPLPAVELEAATTGLGLSPAGERALATLVLAYLDAVDLHHEAKAGLTPDDLGLVNLDPAAVGTWFAKDAARDWDDFNAHVAQIIAERGGTDKTRQAADLLLRAVQAARLPLAQVPAAPSLEGIGPESMLAQALALVGGKPRPTGLSLEEALAGLYSAYGLPVPAALAEHGLPASLANAVAPVVAAKLEGIRSGDAATEAANFLAAADQARPVLEAWAAVLRMQASVPVPVEAPDAAEETPLPWHLGALLGPGAANAPSDPGQAFRDALAAATEGLPGPERAAVLDGATVQGLFLLPSWDAGQAGLVKQWADGHMHMADKDRARLASAAAAAAALPGMEGSAAQAEAAGGPPVPAVPLPDWGEPRQTAGGGPPDLVFDDSAYFKPSFLCWERNGVCAGRASILRIGGAGDSTYGTPALIHIDLDGDDRYETEVAGTGAFRERVDDKCTWTVDGVNPVCTSACPVDETQAVCVPTACAPTPVPNAPPSAPEGPPGTDPNKQPCAPELPEECASDPTETVDQQCTPTTTSCTPDWTGCVQDCVGCSPPSSDCIRAWTPCIPLTICVPTLISGCVPVPGCQQTTTLGGPCYPPRQCTPADATPSPNALFGQSNQAFCVPREFLGHGSYAIEVAGNDEYDTPDLDHTQGALGTIGVSILRDYAGDDRYSAGKESQGYARHGIGLLVDDAGNDRYDAGPRSQGAPGASLQDPGVGGPSTTNGLNQRGYQTYKFAGGGLAGLLDFAGDDAYRFERQGSLNGTSGVALFYDGEGLDTYDDRTPMDSPGVTRAHPAGAFATQGSQTGTSTGMALFIDNGAAEDVYRAAQTEAQPRDLSAIKNDRRLLDGDAGVVWLFADGPAFRAAELDDPDGDGAITFFETTLGTDDQSADSNPGNVFQAARNGAAGQDPGLDDPGAWVWTPHPTKQGLTLPGLVIGGRLDDTYSTWVPFLVDLDGDDQYLARNVGGVAPLVEGLSPSRQAGGFPPVDVVVLLDASGDGAGGDDRYEPDAASCTWSIQTPPSFTYAMGDGAIRSGSNLVVPATCPSLGGAHNGIAILADDGGHNLFRSAMALNATAVKASDAEVHAQVAAFGVTQGAGLFGGVGVLATWDATNDFQSKVTVSARDLGTNNPNPLAFGFGVAQGAGLGGIGLLVGLGPGSDHYTTEVEASALAFGVQQGFARSVAQGAGYLGIGLLFDEGGANQYLAPDGMAQGFAYMNWLGAQGLVGIPPPSFFSELNVPPTQNQILSLVPESPTVAGPDRLTGQAKRTPASVGILWPGAQDDLLRAGPVSQGAAIGYPSLGALVDSGGNDRRFIAGTADALAGCARPDASTCGHAQGAGSAGATALLLDLEGDDLNSAEGHRFVQGAADAATGLLVDQSGHDTYRAASQSQGFGLYDPTIVPDQGLIAAPAYGAEFVALGLLADLDGLDAYEAIGESQGFVGVFSLPNPWLHGSVEETAVLLSDRTGTFPSKPPQAIPSPDAPVGIFVDGGGSDHYTYDGVKCSRTALGCESDLDGNGWRWHQAHQASLGVALGVDDENADHALSTAWAVLNQALASGGSNPVPAKPTPVRAFRDAAGSQPVQGDITGNVFIFTDVLLRDPLKPGDIDRVDFFADGNLLGPGELVPQSQPPRYRIAWATRLPGETPLNQTTLDGPTTLLASAFLRPEASGAGRQPTGTLTSTHVESEPVDLQVDNPPLLGISLSRTLLATDPERNEVGNLMVSVSSDRLPDGQEGQSPAQLRVVAQGAGGGTKLLHDGWAQSTAVPLQVTADCDGSPGAGTQPCPDGRYAITATATDRAGRSTTTGRTLVLDGTAPVSAVETGPVHNEPKISWSSRDDPPGLGAGNSSGVASVRVLQLTSSNDLKQQLCDCPPDLHELDVSEKELRILTVATDRLGHSESPCLAGEASPCFRAKLAAHPESVANIVIDTVAPSLSQLSSTPSIVSPGGQARFTARALDTSGVAVAIAFSQGFQDAAMAPGTGGTFSHVAVALPLAEPAEVPVIYEVTARDPGGNEATRFGTIFVDGRAPLVAPLATVYGDPDESLEAAQPGDKLQVQARIEDLAVSSVQVDASAIGGSAQAPCRLKSGKNPWLCDLELPSSGVADGTYAVRWIATDAAGNSDATGLSEVLVSGQEPELLDVEAEATGYDSIAVRWRTATPTRPHVAYGTTQELRSGTVLGDDPATEHELVIEGLASATQYYVKAFSTTRSGIPGSSAVLPVKTGSSYALAFPGLESAPRLHGVAQVALEVAAFDGTLAPAAVSLFVQDADARASPLPVLTQEFPLGTTAFELDTSTLPDGDYRLLSYATRNGEPRQDLSAAFLVDNLQPLLSPLQPRPAGITAALQPMLSLSVLDPAADGPLDLASLVVRVNGTVVEPVSAGYANAWERGVPQRLSILLGHLPDGLHEVVVAIRDAAGNEGTATWSFWVDCSAPTGTLKVRYAPGLNAARPGASFTLVANLTDPNGVASGVLEDPTFGEAVPFVRGAGDEWLATVQVPDGTLSGAWSIPARFVDALGNSQVVAATLQVDGQPPQVVSAAARTLGYTDVQLTLEASEPVRFEARSGAAHAEANGLLARHELRLDGLTPGKEHQITLLLTDGAGHESSTTIWGRTVADEEAPPAVAAEATSAREGIVTLQWTAAKDNAGIAAYRIERLDGATWTRLADAAGNASRYDDLGAPAGHLAAYRVRAIDVANLAGPATEIRVLVQALPVLEAAQASPRVATADTLFLFQVTYRHASGKPPAEAYVAYGDLRVPLAPLAGDCLAGCLLEARARLPAADLSQRTPTVVFHATDGRNDAMLDLGWTPRVSSGLDGLPGSNPVPGAGLPMLLGALALALAYRTSRRSLQP